MKSINRKLALALASTAFIAPLGVQSIASTASAMCPPDDPCPTQTAPTARDKVITRAKTWVAANGGEGVPYSQVATYGGYRADCSGYASMALGRSKPGLNTVGLADSSVSNPITMKSLKKGDLVIDANGTSTSRHVVIFEKWANDAHTLYWSYEQSGTYDTRRAKHNYGFNVDGKDDQYNAYRPKSLV